MLNIDDLIVDSFPTTAGMSEIGHHETGCFGPCEPQLTADFC
ncbi:MAG TPA: hypothetical protein VE871_10010 [Longimicrobium sp.]|nr:hypothetical protein [Longimicrobium sp.]